MPFIPYGKKSKKKRAELAAREANEQIIDRAVTGAQLATMRAPDLCLPICGLVERLLVRDLPASRFSIKLGALKVYPITANVDPIGFDPRAVDGTPPLAGILAPNAGFHAWLESADGELLDPSILLTLAAKGYDVELLGYFLGGGRRFERYGLMFVYEELHELELLGVEESALWFERAMVAATRMVPMELGHNVLDIKWKPRSSHDNT